MSSNLPLARITDLASLDEPGVAEFQRAVPCIIAYLQMQRIVYATSGRSLRELIPTLPFSTGKGDTITMTLDGKQREVPGDVFPEVAKEMFVKHGEPVRKSTYRLEHITDLADIHPADVASFQNDVPTLVAMLQLAKAECEKDGVELDSMFPHLTFAPAMGDAVMMRSEDRTLLMEGSDVRAAAPRRPRP